MLEKFIFCHPTDDFDVTIDFFVCAALFIVLSFIQKLFRISGFLSFLHQGYLFTIPC